MKRRYERENQVLRDSNDKLTKQTKEQKENITSLKHYLTAARKESNNKEQIIEEIADETNEISDVFDDMEKLAKTVITGKLNYRKLMSKIKKGRYIIKKIQIKSN